MTGRTPASSHNGSSREFRASPVSSPHGCSASRSGSGVTSKSRFIAARLFGEPFRVVKVDKSAVEYCAKLTEFYAQFRAVAVNYNQVVKALHSNFSEKKALAFLYKLEKATTELVMLNRQVIDLTNECRELWLPK